MLQNMKIGTRLGLAFATVLLMMLIVGVFAILQLARVNGNVADLSTNWMAGSRALGDFNNQVGLHRRIEYRHVLATKPEDKASNEKAIADREKAIDEAWKRYVATITGKEERQLADAIQAALKNYYTTTPKLFALSNQGAAKLEETSAFMGGESLTAFNALSTALDKDLKFQDTGAVNATQEAEVAYGRTRWTVIALIVAALLIGIWMAHRITRSITAPLAQAVNAAQKVAQGDLTSRITAAGKNEISQLLAALGDMNSSLVQIV